MLNYEDIENDIREIISIGDEALASSKIIKLRDKITDDASETVATINDLNAQITELNNDLNKQKEENETIRNNNKDLLLRYGQLVAKAQPIITEEPVEEDTTATKSWSDIAKMD